MKKMMIAKVATPKNTARIKKMIAAAIRFTTPHTPRPAPIKMQTAFKTVSTVSKKLLVSTDAPSAKTVIDSITPMHNAVTAGYGNDNPGAKSQGMKQLMAGLALILLGIVMIPVLVGMMNITTG